MGYTTEFTGTFSITPPLSPEHLAYLLAFKSCRHMRRDASIAATFPDAKRLAVELPIGEEGGYHVGGAEQHHGQGSDSSVIDFNQPPNGQPSLHCCWEPNESGTTIRWDQSEKFYCYVEWLEYLVGHFLKPWGYQANGRVQWSGEKWEDTGEIEVAANNVVHGPLISKAHESLRGPCHT